MTKHYTTKQSVLTEAKKILGRSLREVMLDSEVNVNEIEKGGNEDE